MSGEYYGSVLFFENDGQNNFTQQTGTDNPFDDIDVGYTSAPTLADIDDDGDLDLVIGNSSGEFQYFENVTENPNGIFDFTSGKVSLNIHPNPATSIINTEEGQLEILDLTGNAVLSTESTGQVDVSGLESGVYIVTQNGKRTKMIIE